MDEKTVIMGTATTAITASTAEETSAEETAASTVASQAECELPTVNSSAEADSSMVASEAEKARTADFIIPLSSLDNLNKLTAFVGELYTYSYLLNKATGMTDPALFIDARMCDDLAEAITADEFLTVMKEFITAIDYVKGIEVRKDQLVFTCFQNLQDAGDTGMKKAAASLFNLISASITGEKADGKKRRLNLHKVAIKQPENEKFAFRSWLTKLGWKGAEGKMERNLLYRNLDGNTAFCTEESKIRWEAKHKKGKKSEPTVTTPAEEETTVETTVAEPETDMEAVAV